MSPTSRDVVARLAARGGVRTEADIQADVYLLLTSGGLQLRPEQVARLEVPVADGTRRRLDVEIGHAAIEVKKDLRVPGVLTDAERQLAGYVVTRAQLVGRRYVGILTDGTTWRLYHLSGDELGVVAELRLSEQQPDGDRLVAWLEAVLSTDAGVKPSPQEIQQRLGANSPAHLLDHATLRALYERAIALPEVQLKRQLWAKLLRTAFGKSFDDDADLFIDHTLLVLSAEIIAHAVLGFDVSRAGDLSAQALARGTAFADALIYGVVEADFFDWVLDVEDGPEFVRGLADRISRFDWGHVEHDVLKILYESVIPPEARANLGEYYTPDWLAERVVAETVRDPLRQRVLDPACGSGTFLFHAIRRFLSEWDLQGGSGAESVAAVTAHVQGLDVHPVAVTLARVTYLLAIGQQRLAQEERPAISIPVYLGDSMQWEQHRDLFGGVDEITVSTEGDDLIEGGGGALFGDDLVFPRSVLQDAAHFDRLVAALADRSQDSSSRKSRDLILPVLRQFGVHEGDVDRLVETFDTMRRLHATGKDHIWAYYVRNLIRPLWLSEPANQVDVLVGNPPWLRYSKMTASMQQRYKRLSGDRGLLSGPLGASGRDLSTLFLVRTVELYLRDGGEFAMVMPHGTLTRRPHEGFRSGDWGSKSLGPLKVQFGQSWDLSKAPTGFPMVSCVVQGVRVTDRASALTGDVLRWTVAKARSGDAIASAPERLRTEPGTVVVQSNAMPEPSAYKARFRQGAVLAPLVLIYVVDAPAGPLGAGAGQVAVQSFRSSLEKKPWRDVETHRGTVERSFVRRVVLGESVVPFRMLEPRRAVLPVGDQRILTPAELEGYPAMRKWWASAEESWSTHKSAGDDSALLERVDFHAQLSSQLPTAPHRVVYTKAGSNLAAARVTDPTVLVDFGLYWGAVSSEREALYLTAVLNSGALLARVKPLQTLGLFGTRHFDKYVFSLPIPVFDDRAAEHIELVDLARTAESIAAETDLSGIKDFKAARIAVKSTLTALMGRIDELVVEILSRSERGPV